MSNENSILLFSSESERGDEALAILRRAHSDGFRAEDFQADIFADRDPMETHPICFMTEEESEDAQLLDCVVTMAAQITDASLQGENHE